MSKSLIIVALALGSLNNDVFAQQSHFVSTAIISQNVPNTVLIASGGNPWALPEPDAEYSYQVEPRPQPKPRPERPRYITPEELKGLSRLPPERNYSVPGRALQNADKLPNDRFRQGVSVGPGYYGSSYYPSGSHYGSPYGISPLYDPYGGSYNLPYGGILPFLY